MLPANIKASAHQIAMVVDFIGQPFALPRLIEMAEKVGIQNPHSSVNSLISGPCHPARPGRPFHHEKTGSLNKKSKPYLVAAACFCRAKPLTIIAIAS